MPKYGILLRTMIEEDSNKKFEPIPVPKPLEDTQPDFSKLNPENVDSYLNTLQSSGTKQASPNKRLLVIAIAFLIFMAITGLIVMQFSSSAQH
jgi:hypothetical protein